MTSDPQTQEAIPYREINVPDPLSLASLRGKVSEEEWHLRCGLAATYRLVALFGWDDMVFTHISLRLPDENGRKRFLMNPYGIMFDEMTASALLVVDENGEVIGDTPYFSNPAGFTIHSAFHLARADAHCVLHLHSLHGVAVSAQPDGLRPSTQFSMIVGNDVAYHDYEGIATDLNEREKLVEDIGDHSFMILRNHGTLTIGENCALAFMRMYFLEQACHAQILAQSNIKPPTEASPDLAEKVYQQAASGFAAGVGDKLVWPSLLRKLNRENPGHNV